MPPPAGSRSQSYAVSDLYRLQLSRSNRCWHAQTLPRRVHDALIVKNCSLDAWDALSRENWWFRDGHELSMTAHKRLTVKRLCRRGISDPVQAMPLAGSSAGFPGLLVTPAKQKIEVTPLKRYIAFFLLAVAGLMPCSIGIRIKQFKMVGWKIFQSTNTRIRDWIFPVLRNDMIEGLSVVSFVRRAQVRNADNHPLFVGLPFFTVESIPGLQRALLLWEINNGRKLPIERERTLFGRLANVQFLPSTLDCVARVKLKQFVVDNSLGRGVAIVSYVNEILPINAGSLSGAVNFFERQCEVDKSDPRASLSIHGLFRKLISFVGRFQGSGDRLLVLAVAVVHSRLGLLLRRVHRTGHPVDVADSLPHLVCGFGVALPHLLKGPAHDSKLTTVNISNANSEKNCGGFNKHFPYWCLIRLAVGSSFSMALYGWWYLRNEVRIAYGFCWWCAGIFLWVYAVNTWVIHKGNPVKKAGRELLNAA